MPVFAQTKLATCLHICEEGVRLGRFDQGGSLDCQFLLDYPMSWQGPIPGGGLMTLSSYVRSYADHAI